MNKNALAMLLLVGRAASAQPATDPVALDGKITNCVPIVPRPAHA
jgi:hypothetical protein